MNFCSSDIVVVVIAKPARAVALLLGDHNSSHASTDSLVDPSLVVGPDDVSTGRWVVDQETGRRGSGGPCAPGHLVVVLQRDRRHSVIVHFVIPVLFKFYITKSCTN